MSTVFQLKKIFSGEYWSGGFGLKSVYVYLPLLMSRNLTIRAGRISCARNNVISINPGTCWIELLLQPFWPEAKTKWLVPHLGRPRCCASAFSFPHPCPMESCFHGNKIHCQDMEIYLCIQRTTSRWFCWSICYKGKNGESVGIRW